VPLATNCAKTYSGVCLTKSSTADVVLVRVLEYGVIHDDGIFERMLASPLFIVVGIGVGMLIVSYIMARERLENEEVSLFERMLRWVGASLVIGSACWAFFFGIPREVPEMPCDVAGETQDEPRKSPR